MPATRYKVMTVGNRVLDATGNPMGVTGAVNIAIAGIAKRATTNEPYILANELVCNGLARLLMLPCPPGAAMDSGGVLYFFSLDFNVAGQSLPPIDPDTVVATFPELSWGVILFDSLIMNHDRHTMNISHDTASNKVTIFDHSHAFVQPAGDISTTITYNWNSICLGGHCLANKINTTNGRDMWLERIRNIPDYYIEGIIDAAITIGLPSDKKDECINVLKHRRTNLETILNNNLNSFPNLPAAQPAASAAVVNP